MIVMTDVRNDGEMGDGGRMEWNGMDYCVCEYVQMGRAPICTPYSMTPYVHAYTDSNSDSHQEL